LPHRKHDPRVIDLTTLMRALYNKQFSPKQRAAVLNAARHVINTWSDAPPPDYRIHRLPMPSMAFH
jgi:hypothetical protein